MKISLSFAGAFLVLASCSGNVGAGGVQAGGGETAGAHAAPAANQSVTEPAGEHCEGGVGCCGSKDLIEMPADTKTVEGHDGCGDECATGCCGACEHDAPAKPAAAKPAGHQ